VRVAAFSNATTLGMLNFEKRFKPSHARATQKFVKMYVCEAVIKENLEDLLI